MWFQLMYLRRLEMKYLLRSYAVLFNPVRCFFSKRIFSDETLLLNAKIALTSGELERAEKLYWSVLNINPKNEIPYREIFNIWAKKASVLGFHDSEKMQTLKAMYNEHIKNSSSISKKAA